MFNTYFEFVGLNNSKFREETNLTLSTKSFVDDLFKTLQFIFPKDTKDEINQKHFKVIFEKQKNINQKKEVYFNYKILIQCLWGG
jgi:hypothetical protein